MRIKITILLWILALGSALYVAAQPRSKDGSSTPVVRNNNEDAEAMRADGEQRFRANCGRCHAAPHKFPPRIMATVVRHMRVRATITDEDMRRILYYMTQ
jgi:mono/diheme cytochrome c family protein